MTATRIAAWFKANGWVVNLLFILVGGYFVGGTVNSVVAKTVRVVPTSMPTTRTVTATNSSRKPEYVSMAGRNLLGALRENLHPVEEVEETETPQEELGNDYNPNDLRKCTIPASLRATLVAEENPEWSIAVLYNNSSREAEVFSVNEGNNQIAPDATVIEIRSREIVVRRSDHFELCMAEGEGEAPMPTPARPARAQPQPASSGDDDGAIQKTGETSYTISRDYLQNSVLNNLSQVATQARIVPSFKNGKPNGFKLFSIKPNSIYSKLGLQNGDVIHKINGYEMSSPDKALEIYQKLKDASNITVDMTRRGQSKNFSYGVQ